jgi:hypothetical protein
VGEGLGGRGGREQRHRAERGPKPRSSSHAKDGARATAAVLSAACALCLAACGGGIRAAAPAPPYDPHSRPIGVGADYHPPPGAHATRGLECRRGGPRRYGVHLELFAHRLVVLVPPGIGVAPPLVRHGAYVVGGRCSYPARTLEPTGVIQVARGSRPTLGDLFRIWGQPLASERLLTFHGRVRAFFGGQRWTRPLASIPLSYHAEIQLEIAGHVPPRVGYRFRPGL